MQAVRQTDRQTEMESENILLLYTYMCMKNLQPNSLPAAQRQVSHSNNNSQNKKPRMERQWPEEQKMAGVVYSVNQPKMLN